MISVEHPYQNRVVVALRARREEFGPTQAEIAHALGFNPMQLSHLENGRREVRSDVLEQWGQALRPDVQVFAKPIQTLPEGQPNGTDHSH